MTDNILNYLEEHKHQSTDENYKNAIEELGKLLNNDSDDESESEDQVNSYLYDQIDLLKQQVEVLEEKNELLESIERLKRDRRIAKIMLEHKKEKVKK